MKTITIKEKVSKKTSNIFIGNGLLEKISEIVDLSNFSNLFIVTDKNLEKLIEKKLIPNLPENTSLIALGPGESEKNIDSVQKIWVAMKKSHCDRKTLVINVGGGVVCDIGGFAASTFMRGIDFINVPTTLLAQVDASIGGKTGIDFNGIKNLIGTFSLPLVVIIDPTLLTTLPKREFISGFGEVIKHGLVKDKKHFQQATVKHPLDFTKDELLDIIIRSCEVKAEIVKTDKTEKSARKLLNFGHTIGHAIEAISLESKIPLLHGEAVSIGIVAEAKISLLLGLLSQREFEKIVSTLTNSGLPNQFKDIEVSQIMKKIQSDKKNEKGETNFTLLRGIGNAIVNQKVSGTLIIQSLKSAL